MARVSQKTLKLLKRIHKRGKDGTTVVVDAVQTGREMGLSEDQISENLDLLAHLDFIENKGGPMYSMTEKGVIEMEARRLTPKKIVKILGGWIE